MIRTEDQQRLREWTYGHKHLARMRDEAKDAIERGRIDENFLLRTIRTSVVESEFLYRGTHGQTGTRKLKLVVGESFEMLPCSFTKDVDIASSYFKTPGLEDEVPIFLLLKGRVHGIDLEHHFAGERPLLPPARREVIVAGRFQLVDKQPLHAGHLLVIEQTGVYPL